MLVTLANGLVVSADVGCLVFRIASQKVDPSEGGLQIVGFEEGLIKVRLADASEILVSGDAIESLACPAQPPVEVVLTDGSRVTVPANVAPVVSALVAAQQTALDQIRNLLDTTQVGQLQTQLDSARAELASAQELLQRRTDVFAWLRRLLSWLWPR